MSYEVRHGESLGENVRRICRKQIEDAIGIASGKEECEETPVHGTRKHLKKARAAARLVRKEIGRGLFRQQDHRLRDVGRLTSEIRDAEARLQTVRELQRIKRRRDGARFQRLEEMLLMELENFMAAFAEWQTQAIPVLEEACAALDCWKLDHFNRKQLRCAVQASYKDARDALAEAKTDPSTENFHEFRSKVKVLLYQLRIVRPINAVVLKSLGDELGALGSLLGRAHDLSFLGERLRVEQGKSQWQRESQKLLAVIEVGETDLQAGATELAERFFAEPPRDFGKRIASWLEGWEKTSSESLMEQLV
jgi:CHAD domain-containing protein